MSDMTVRNHRKYPLESYSRSKAGETSRETAKPAEAERASGSGAYKLTIEYTSLRMGWSSYDSYSKDQALLDTLRERYGSDVAVNYESGDMSGIPQEELAALEQELRSSGRSDVMWGSYTRVTIEMTFSSMEELQAKLGDSVDILCAAREAQGNILPQHYSGTELAEQTDRMDSLFRQSMEQITDAFAELVGGFLDANGQTGQTEKVRMSVQSLFVSYQAKYRAISGQNSDPTGTADTPDAWLGSHFNYLTSSLLKLGKRVETQQSTEGEGLYTLKELEFAAMSVTAWQSAISRAARGGGGSEARQALTVSMISMKIEMASARGVIGGEMADTLRSVQDSAGEQLLDAMDKCQAKRWEEHEGDGNRDTKFRPADRELFSRVRGKVMDAYHRTGDAMGAIREGAAMAKPELEKAAEDKGKAQRWEGEMARRGYWDTFQEDSPYHAGGYQSFENDWQSFMDEIGGDRDGRSGRGNWNAKA